MIVTLVMALCMSQAPDGSCEDWQVSAPASWEGPDALKECRDNKRELANQLTPKNRQLVRFACEPSQPANEHTSWRF